MNNNQLRKLNVPEDCIREAIQVVQKVAKYNRTVDKVSRIDLKSQINKCVNNTQDMLNDPYFGSLAFEIKKDREFVKPDPIDYKIWGEMDDNTKSQMDLACHIPTAKKAAVMPDNHLGYGLPCGGIIATKDSIIPGAVGVDISCMMKLTVYDIPVSFLDSRKHQFETALMNGTVFGVGKTQKTKYENHDVFDYDWSITGVTEYNKDKAVEQLGTSGSGNHFVEWGTFKIDNENDLNIPGGEYVALLSHSGSRGAGASVAKHYDNIARKNLNPKYSELSYLAWLDINSESGQEYWLAMNLMGKYASANHDVIHKRVLELIGDKPIVSIENFHNFAWKENHDGEELYVHRKGATPAGEGVLGVIPGSMASPAYIVKGKGNVDSLMSASHGAGRLMSRRKAKEKYNFNAVKNDLAKKGVTILSAGADEVPGAYKNIDDVMSQQKDLVDVIARFDPKIVRMSNDD